MHGALALEPRRVSRTAEDTRTPRKERPARPGSALQVLLGSGTVPRMAWPQAPGLATRTAHRERERAKARRARRIAALVVVAGVALVTLLLTAFGSGASERTTTGPAPAGRLLPSGPPQPQVVALFDTLRIQLPIAQGRVTAIGYHASGPEAFPLEPVGEQQNAGLFTRLMDKLFSQSSSGLGYYILDGGTGSQTGGLDIGAPVETDVYAPVDGTVIAISEQIVNGQPYGVRIDIQPSGNPGYVVVVSSLTADPALTVGTTVEAARSKIGRVVDLSEVEQAELAQFTQDKGQHVHLEVHAATSLTAP